MGTESSLPSSQQPGKYPYPKPEENSVHALTFYFFFQDYLFTSGFPIKILYASLFSYLRAIDAD